jgi:hypothetical protein
MEPARSKPALATAADPAPPKALPAKPTPPEPAVEVPAEKPPAEPGTDSAAGHSAPERAPASTPTPPDAGSPTAPQTAAPEPAAAPPQTAAPAAPGSDLDRLLTSWPEIVTSVRPATRAVITECRPMSVDGNVVTLGFPEAKAFLKDVAERKRADLEAAVGGFLGRSVSVRCVATNIDLVPPVSGDDESGRIFAEAKRIFEDDLVDVGEVS